MHWVASRPLDTAAERSVKELSIRYGHEQTVTDEKRERERER